MSITKQMDHFYYKMALYELQVLNEQDYTQGISYNSMLYINVIYYKQKCTLSELAQALHVTKSAVTIKINELIKKNLVEKIQSEDDKRVFYVRVSKEMMQMMEMYGSIFSAVAEDLNKQFTPEQLETFSSILHVITQYEWRKIKNE